MIVGARHPPSGSAGGPAVETVPLRGATPHWSELQGMVIPFTGYAIDRRICGWPHPDRGRLADPVNPEPVFPVVDALLTSLQDGQRYSTRYGEPLVDATRHAVGIITACSGSAEGLGFANPIDCAASQTAPAITSAARRSRRIMGRHACGP